MTDFLDGLKCKICRLELIVPALLISVHELSQPARMDSD